MGEGASEPAYLSGLGVQLMQLRIAEGKDSVRELHRSSPVAEGAARSCARHEKNFVAFYFHPIFGSHVSRSRFITVTLVNCPYKKKNQ